MWKMSKVENCQKLKEKEERDKGLKGMKRKEQMDEGVR